MTVCDNQASPSPRLMPEDLETQDSELIERVERDRHIDEVDPLGWDDDETD